MLTATPNVNFVILFVKDPIQSSAFYSRLFKIEPAEKSATFAMFILPNGITLGLWSEKTAEPPTSVKSGGCELAFADEDVDAVHEHWQMLGIPIAQPPTNMDFGRTCVGLDPDGHRIRVFKTSEKK